MIHRKMNLGIVCLLMSLSIMQWSCAGTKATEKDALTVFLVRHAEKADKSRDPELSPEGEQRAELLAKMLADSSIEHIHSSEYKRTMNTAQAVADMLGLDIQTYDPRDLNALAEKLKKQGGKHLVVGHSNSTPSLVGLLGGDPGSPIDDASEYDRLYIVTVSGGGEVGSTLLRYGNAQVSNDQN